MDISKELRAELASRGADLVGYGDLRALDPHARQGLPVGVSVAMRYPRAVIAGIDALPTPSYFANYNKLNAALDAAVTHGAAWLEARGFTAIAQTLAAATVDESTHATQLPHKTVATRAGLGWIGKCALLITPEYGSMVRLSSLLTDAPLETAEPINASRCGNCTVCRDVCPANAVSGKHWQAGMLREELYDAELCMKAAKQRSLEGLGREATVCGRCILHCPYTQKFIRSGK